MDGYRRGLCAITSAGSSDKLVPEEPSDNIENKEVPTSECSEPIVVPEEPSDGIQNAKVPIELLKKVFDQTSLLILRTIYGSDLTDEGMTFLMFIMQPQTVTSKITDVDVTSEFMDSENASNLLPFIDNSHETIPKEAVSVPNRMSSASRSFGPLRPSDSRAMIKVINKLLKLLFYNLELAITKFDKCPKQDLYIAIILTLLALTGRYLYFEFYEIMRHLI